ncbi:CoA ester lyase [Homoserinimonas sp. OAct 916]|uniref:HpcH/HpaI aldolase/citrate lyase family protein n=1 Tax=Homoserinimonas sp. OAct 916 TaxID=2211450 RepID=UPI000DBE1560|nr:CoA ester lyase [Homoserinimonas sp. OAct 916]
MTGASGFALGPALLFCPADRPERYAKAAERSDAVILDLEDAVAASSKEDARSALAASTLDPERTIVRVNPVSSADFALDIAAIAQTSYRYLMVPKAESSGQMQVLAASGAHFRVIALCESAAGVLASAEIAAEPNVVALMWGAEDLVVSLGGTASRFADGRYRPLAVHARSQVLLAAGANGKAAVDTVYFNIPDTAGLEVEASDARASGFVATACIHPSQVAVIRAAYRPGDHEVAYARDVLAAAAGERGVFSFRGQMVDNPVLRNAEQTLRRAAPEE